MDTSKQYIKMCQEAHEIHNKFMEFGDYFADLFENKSKVKIFIVDGKMISEIGVTHNFSENEIWLPRQDQLQEILFDKDRFLNSNPVMIINNLFGYINEDHFKHDVEENGLMSSSLILFKTLEQLTLSLVMNKEFNKNWNFETETWEVCKIKE